MKKASEDTKVYTVKVGQDVIEKLDSYCKKSGKGRSAALNSMLEDYLAYCGTNRGEPDIYLPWKRPKQAINIRFNLRLYGELEKFCEKTGRLKNIAIERIIIAYADGLLKGGMESSK